VTARTEDHRAPARNHVPPPTNPTAHPSFHSRPGIGCGIGEAA
jgi:hypothetical protein